MLKRLKIFIISLILLLIFTITVSARYVFLKKDTVNIVSAASNVEVSIDSTSQTLTSSAATGTFNVTILNNNNYDITYTVLPTSSMFSVDGGESDVTISSGTSKIIPITVKCKSVIDDMEATGTANIKVDINKPYQLDTKEFDLQIEVLGDKMSDLITEAHNTVKPTTPEFSENITTVASSGLYKTEDESGDTYYYRGVVPNNYIVFAEKLWRIVRINGDGSYRIILDEPIGTSSFAATSSTTYNNIGYMYSEVSTPRENKYNSTIKEYLENWYTNNIEASYDDYVDKDAIFWQDRTVYTTDSYSTIYAGWNRIVTNSPSLKPGTTDEEKKDWFSVTTTKGNGKLSKPIGLITADEIVLAGGTMTGATLTGFGTYYENTSCYLNLGTVPTYGCWTMTPRRFTPSSPANSHMIVSKPQASIYTEPVYHATVKRYVKPVINLKSSIVVEGKGTATEPYVVKSVE